MNLMTITNRLLMMSVVCPSVIFNAVPLFLISSLTRNVVVIVVVEEVVGVVEVVGGIVIEVAFSLFASSTSLHVFAKRIQLHSTIDAKCAGIARSMLLHMLLMLYGLLLSSSQRFGILEHVQSLKEKPSSKTNLRIGSESSLIFLQTSSRKSLFAVTIIIDCVSKKRLTMVTKCLFIPIPRVN